MVDQLALAVLILALNCRSNDVDFFSHNREVALRCTQRIRTSTKNRRHLNFRLQLARRPIPYEPEVPGGGCPVPSQPDSPRLFFFQILSWNIVLRYLVSANFLLVIVPSGFHAAYNVGLERVAFLD